MPAEPRRIVSLLPSATEICCELGLDDRLVGISHECDFPDIVVGRPVLTESKIDPTGSSRDIDTEVRGLVAEGLSVYRIDEELLRELRPDLIVTQDTCEVCAVSLDEVREATRRLVGNEVEILSLSPLLLGDVFEDVKRVGVCSGAEEIAQEAVRSLRRRLDGLRRETRELDRPRVAVLEWLDPPMIAGHWTPELIRIAGGRPVLGRDGTATGPIEWSAIVEARPEVLLVAPCGFKVAQSLREMEELSRRPGFAELPAVLSERVWIADGNAFFNRPGPRLVESAEAAAAAIHTDRFAERFSLGTETLLQWRGV
jgi:iron complex transport system substrate-binding protein